MWILLTKKNCSNESENAPDCLDFDLFFFKFPGGGGGMPPDPPSRRSIDSSTRKNFPFFLSNQLRAMMRSLYEALPPLLKGKSSQRQRLLTLLFNSLNGATDVQFNAVLLTDVAVMTECVRQKKKEKKKKRTIRNDLAFVSVSTMRPNDYNNNNNNNININSIKRRNLRFFFNNLLTAPRTVSYTYAHVARVQSCANHVQHIEHLPRATCATWYERSIISLAEPLTDEGWEETGVPGENPWRRASLPKNSSCLVNDFF